MSDDTSTRGFTEDEERALASVLDEIIPASGDGKLPGAGELGLASHIEQTLVQFPDLRPMVIEGLSAIVDLARKRNSTGFRALSEQERQEVLKEFLALEPAFPSILMFHTYIGYYQDSRVVEALGLPPRPPQPDGYNMEPSDLTSLLDGVRRRHKLYREC